jgi:hypothetical protein
VIIGERLGTLNRKGGQVRGQRDESVALIGVYRGDFKSPVLRRYFPEPPTLASLTQRDAGRDAHSRADHWRTQLAS